MPTSQYGSIVVVTDFPIRKFALGGVIPMNRVINEKLGAWLLVSGNTREKLADEIGITRPTLNGRLDGKSKWMWDEVVEVARITGCSLNELAGIREHT